VLDGTVAATTPPRLANQMLLTAKTFLALVGKRPPEKSVASLLV
jgi:hypothetical protein